MSMLSAISSEALETTVRLEKQQVYAAQFLGPQMAYDLRIEQFNDAVNRGIVQLSSFVLTEKLDDAEKIFHFMWPRSWWQGFKQIHLPNFVRWHLVPKVKYIERSATATVGSEAWFPKASIITPDLGKPVYMRQVNWNVRSDT